MRKLFLIFLISFFIQSISLKGEVFELSECLERTDANGKVEQTWWIDNLIVSINSETKIISINQTSNKFPEYNHYLEFKIVNYTSNLIIGRSYSDGIPSWLYSDGPIVQGEIFIELKKKQYKQTSYPNGWKGVNIEFYLDAGYTQNQIEAKYKKESWKTFCKKTNFDESNDNQGGSQKASSSGTAFFINAKGYLLTNNHVVEGCKLQQVKYNNKDYEAKIIATDKTLDLALMKIEAKPKNYLNFSESSPEKLQKVYVAGYPFGKGLSDDLKISSGIVSSVKGFDDNSNEFQLDAAINPGNSGGPIVDDTGELIGIAVAGLAKDKSEGINFGIKSLSAVAFLKTNNIDPETSIMTFGMNNKKLLQLLEESTVYTYCN